MRIQNRANWGEGGFSILELLIVVVVLTIGLLAFGSFSGVIIDRNENSRKMTIASTLAQDKLEYFKNLSLGTTLSNTLNGTETVNASGVVGSGGAYYYTRTWTFSTSGTLKTVTVVVTWTEKATSRTVTLSTLINQ